MLAFGKLLLYRFWMKAYGVTQKYLITTTVVLIKKLCIAEETSKEVTPCPSAVRGLYRLPKIHKKNLLPRRTIPLYRNSVGRINSMEAHVSMSKQI
jgi:hypothetical protein